MNATILSISLSICLSISISSLDLYLSMSVLCMVNMKITLQCSNSQGYARGVCTSLVFYLENREGILQHKSSVHLSARHTFFLIAYSIMMPLDKGFLLKQFFGSISSWRFVSIVLFFTYVLGCVVARGDFSFSRY